MIALNTAPLGMDVYELTTVCTNMQFKATCKPRRRLFRPDYVDAFLQIGEDFLLYNQKNAASVRDTLCLQPLNGCSNLTFDNGRVFYFIEAGNVYARLINGRQNQPITLSVTITLLDGDEILVTKYINVAR